MELILPGPEAQSRVIIFSLSAGKMVASQNMWMETIEVNSGVDMSDGGAVSSARH